MAGIGGGMGSRLRFDPRRLLTLAGATTCFVVGLFCAWQAWLIADEDSAAQGTRNAQVQAASSLGELWSGMHRRFDQASHDTGVLAVVDDHAAAAARLRQLLPAAREVEVFSPGMDEVVHADYRAFGYAKAAQMLAALGAGGAVRASTTVVGNERRLTVVEPLQRDGTTVAWVWLAYPFDEMRARFEAVSPRGGRLELRQGDGPDSLNLLSNGARSGELQGSAQPVQGTALFVAAAMPRAFIVIPHSEVLAGLLAVLGLGGAAFLVWLRSRPPVQAPLAPEDVLVADVAPKPRLPPAPTPALGVDARALPPPAATPVVAPPPGGVDATIFRAYDIRGEAGINLTPPVAHLVGRAIGGAMQDRDLREIVVGRDGRLSGPELMDALMDGLREAGIDVIDLGAVPTPLVYFACFQFGTGCGVSVTGSHNPPGHNGFKIVIGGETLSGADITDLHRRIAEDRLPSGGHGALTPRDVSDAYVARVADDVTTQRRLKVVVDAGNGIAGGIAPRVLEEIGCEVLPLHCDVDGTFPNHHPDPSDPRNLADLIAAVQALGADIGVAFDGDGDRLGAVTATGEILVADRLLMLFARDVLLRNPGATVIYDVKCTGHLRPLVQEAAGVPLMWRTGHSLIKAKMRETGAALAGEMSGHFFFADNNRWYGFDDGIYAAARLLEIVAGDPEERTVAEIFQEIPNSVSTPELKLPMREGEPQRFMEAFRAAADFGDGRVTTLDGLRVDWPDGWGLCRASNTTAALILRFDADSGKSLERVKQAFRLQMHAVDPKLELPF